MNISVFGLGYVGTVTSACLAEKSHHIIDIDQHGGNGVFGCHRHNGSNLGKVSLIEAIA
jgi:hypothetical protein